MDRFFNTIHARHAMCIYWYKVEKNALHKVFDPEGSVPVKNF
jgi:hypothetical protein